MQNAIQYYPFDQNDTPLALIDSTVFGSAKTGLVIGLKGIYFRNDWSTKTDKNFLSWMELSNSKESIGKGSMNCVFLAVGCEFNMSGSSMDKDPLINLLNQIVDLYRGMASVDVQPTERVDVPPAVAIQPTERVEAIQENTLIENNDNNAPININPTSDSSEQYSKLLPEILALCMTSDGLIEESEVELATAIIDTEDLIVDKESAFELLSKSIDELTAVKAKSNAIFKLKSATITSKISKIDDELHKERLEIMGLQEYV